MTPPSKCYVAPIDRPSENKEEDDGADSKLSSGPGVIKRG